MKLVRAIVCATLAASVLGARGLTATENLAVVPVYEVEATCTRLVGTSDPHAPMRNICIQREQAGYDLVLRLWPAAGADDQAKCSHLAELSKSYRYAYLAACLKSTKRARDLSTPQQFVR